MIAKTTKATTWHEPAKGFFTIPAGSIAEVLSVNTFNLLPDNERYKLLGIQKRKKDQNRDGFFVLLDGLYRWLDKEDVEVLRGATNG